MPVSRVRRPAKGRSKPGPKPKVKVRLLARVEGGAPRMWYFEPPLYNGASIRGWIRETSIRGQQLRYEVVGASGRVRATADSQLLLKQRAARAVEIPYPGWPSGRPVPPKGTWVAEGL